MGAVSVIRAISGLSARHLGQVSGIDSNGRACSDQGSMPQR